MLFFKTLLAPLLVALTFSALSALAQNGATVDCQAVCVDLITGSCESFRLNESKVDLRIPQQASDPNEVLMTGRFNVTRYDLAVHLTARYISFIYVNNNNVVEPDGPFRVNVNWGQAGSTSFLLPPPNRMCNAKMPKYATMVTANAVYDPDFHV